MPKTFALDEGLDLPARIFSEQFAQGDLHIAVENPAWILTSRLETRLLGHLREHRTIREAATVVATEECAETGLVERATATLLEKIEAFGFYQNRTVRDDGKLALHLYLTNACNLRCRHCYKDAGKKLENELSLEEIKSVIDDFSAPGSSQVVLSGGEVLMRPDFFEIAAHAKDRGHKVNVVTNGTLITDKETAARLAAVSDFLQISLDGASPETNDYYRGAGTYDRVIHALNQFEGMDRVVHIGMVVTERNYADIRDHLGNLLQTKIRHKRLQLNVSGLMDYGRGQSCPGAGRDDYVEKVLEVAASLGIARKAWRLPNTKALDCGYARSITVDANGDVFYCPVANDTVQSPLNVRSTPFSDILRHFEEANAAVSVERMTGCHTCELEYICGGGCRLENAAKRHNPLNPGCTPGHKDKIYEALIQLCTDASNHRDSSSR